MLVSPLKDQFSKDLNFLQMIPRKFMTAYGDDITDLIFLEAPAGSIWQVKLKRSNSKGWLQNGWPDFATHYSICFGHLLVFRYKGNSHFHVIILDQSATEVEYPLSATSQSENTYLSTGLEKSKEVTNDDIGRKGDFKNCVALSAKYTKTVSACAKASHQVDKKTVQVTTEAKHDRALASATAFQSTNPFFKIKMCPSYVSGRSLVSFSMDACVCLHSILLFYPIFTCFSYNICLRLYS